MATNKAVKPVVKKPAAAKAPEKKYFYSVLRREELDEDRAPLEDSELWGPFSSPDACIANFKADGYFDDGAVTIFIVEGICTVTLKEERAVVVEKKPL